VVSDSVRGADDVNAVATRGDRKVDVLVWNYHDDDVAAEAARVKVLVSGVPAQGKVKVREFLMDAEHGNAYALWQKVGSPSQPTAAQFVELQRAAVLQPVARASTMKDGRVELPLTLERQGVMLIELSW